MMDLINVDKMTSIRVLDKKKKRPHKESWQKLVSQQL